jgi:protein kinase A
MSETKKEELTEITKVQKFTPADFHYNKILGEGAFGIVRKCELDFEVANGDKSTSEGSGTDEEGDSLKDKFPDKDSRMMAVKLQSKYQLIKNKQQGHLYNEINIMKDLDHPMILKMNGVSQDKRIVFMYLEFMKGGDLMSIVNKFEKLELNHARFYIAQIVLCFEYLHNKHLIFRDLKPENVLIASNGYIKLADFGFIKKVNPAERTYTFCGTPEYIAPEIVQNKGYSQPVDWYALGIMIYELLYGRPPFMANDPYEIFQMILKEKLKFPRDFDKNAKSLIKKLCDHDLSKRIGNLKDGVKDIKEHKFFKGLDWDALLG